MIRKVSHGKKVIKYSLVRTKRVKTSELFVESGCVFVRSPKGKSVSEIDKIVKQKADWILRKQKEYRQSKRQFLAPTFKDGSALPYLGQSYPLHIITGHNRTAIRLLNQEFLVTLESKAASKRKVKSLYSLWLRDKADNLLQTKVSKFSKELVVEPKKVAIKEMKSRWGSATKKGIINLNSSLVKAPEKIVDYIIIHELCHLKIRNHSHHFWNLVCKFVPDYKKKEEWLHQNGMSIV